MISRMGYNVPKANRRRGDGAAAGRGGMGKKLAILSNVNINSLIRAMKTEFEVYEPEGYGNELLLLLDIQSGYHAFRPDITFIWTDLAELIRHEPEEEKALSYMEEWFAALEQGMPGRGVFYLSDGHLWGAEWEVLSDNGQRYVLENAFRTKLEAFCGRHDNAYILPCRGLVERLGAQSAYSETMWYMGKIPYSQAMQKLMCETMRQRVRVISGVPRKVLALDLDNTLWGGLAGEADHEPVLLSEEHKGLAYKNLQRVIGQMRRQGVMLAVVSKNNPEDAMSIIEKHPHMVLRKEDFVCLKINWKPKADNLREMAEQLNVGLDSFVFFDDSQAEREQIRQMLPEVAVPDFPDRPEKLPEAMAEIYRAYFEKAAVTDEDREKTAQYAANARRQEMREQTADLASFLKTLEIRVRVEDAGQNRERLYQLVNKTNQFNLTTVRYDREQLADCIGRADRLVRLYRVTDRFGDNGIVGAVIAALSGDTARIEEFVLSCRVMGRHIEHAVIDRLERELSGLGYAYIEGVYVKTAKNQPVEQLYDQLGYKLLSDTSGEKRYRRALAEPVEREYYIAEWSQKNER